MTQTLPPPASEPRAGRRAVIVGNGPTGSTLALVLARAGWAVSLVDRDVSAPTVTDGIIDLETWDRPGVPQFHQPHVFNNRLLNEMRAVVPDVVERLLEGGDVLLKLPGELESACCRRATLEMALRRSVAEQEGIVEVAESASSVEVVDGEATGLRLRSGELLEADLVVDAAGRRSKLSRAFVDEVVDESVNMVYANRRFKLRPGQSRPGPVNRLTLGVAEGDAFSVVLFPHDGGTFSIGFNYLPEDDRLSQVRHVPVYDAALREIPMVQPWIDPEVSEPISDVILMGGLRNAYRTMKDDAPLRLQAIGDVLCTTNPSLGRGTAMSILAALRTGAAVTASPDDPRAWRTAQHTWQREEIWPWFEVALDMDRSRAGRWKAGLHGVPSGPPAGVAGPPRAMLLPAASADPEIARAVLRHMNMIDEPQVLSDQMPRLVALLAGGWRPGVGMTPEAPPRAELVEVLHEAVAVEEQLQSA